MERRVSERNLHTHAHGSMIYNSQKLEATQASMDKWINKMRFTEHQPEEGRKALQGEGGAQW